MQIMYMYAQLCSQHACTVLGCELFVSKKQGKNENEQNEVFSLFAFSKFCVG